MKKRILAGVLCLMVVASFVGCGKSEGVSTSTVEPVVNSQRPQVGKDEVLTIPQMDELKSIPVDTTAFVDYKVEGLGHTVTFKYAEEAYLLEDVGMHAASLVNETYICSNMGSVEVTITDYNGQVKTAEEAEAQMNKSAMMESITDYSCKPFSIDGYEGYEESYVHTTGEIPQTSYVVFKDDICIFVTVRYGLCPVFDFEFSIQ